MALRPRGPVSAPWCHDLLPGGKFVLGSAAGNITCRASQILGFVAGAATVGVLHPGMTWGIDAVSFGIWALIVLLWVQGPAVPTAGRDDAAFPVIG